MKNILIVAGTRPEIIKLAPVMLAAKRRGFAKLEVRLCLTGQHESMANEALAIFGIEGDENLRIMGANQTPNDVSAAIFQKLPEALRKYSPDVVIVQGDTTSAAAAAICAFNMRIPVAHVEAGLRSHDLDAPFPEELNRKVVTCTAQYNFCPTTYARQNLVRESVSRNTLFLTGNTIVDALRIISEQHNLDDLAKVHGSLRKPFVLVTAHRRESFGEGIEHICDALKQCSAKFPEYQFVYPVHLNPNINGPVRERLSNIRNVLLLPPVSYLVLLTLLRNCELVVSDSGGIQEEAPSFGKYCIVLRDVTERMESVDKGLSELVGTNTTRIVKAVSERIAKPIMVRKKRNPYGDGHASEKILDILMRAGKK
ncbi:MAG TPA: UDP-N-acetylglucosamine 2-epimerase (non-hydrolyzing) [Bacteroidota bacterium]